MINMRKTQDDLLYLLGKVDEEDLEFTVKKFQGKLCGVLARRESENKVTILRTMALKWGVAGLAQLPISSRVDWDEEKQLIQQVYPAVHWTRDGYRPRSKSFVPGSEPQRHKFTRKYPFSFPKLFGELMPGKKKRRSRRSRLSEEQLQKFYDEGLITPPAWMNRD